MSKKNQNMSTEVWNALTERIYQGVGAHIHETRKIQFHLRFVLACLLVAVTFITYAIALWLA
jgi:hypothetical protein